MKKAYLIRLLALLPIVTAAQGNDTKTHSIPNVTIYGHRPMKEIGTQLTRFDSLAHTGDVERHESQ